MPFSLGIWDQLPASARKRLRRLLQPARLGTLRRTTPISERWGEDRGIPIDRYYIEMFLNQHRKDIHGQVLEVGDRKYTDRFGFEVEHCDVLDNNSNNPRTTIFVNLENADTLPSEHYDCLVITQVLQFIFQLRPCLSNLYRSLKPGGVLLATVPCVSRLDLAFGKQRDYWRFTSGGCQLLFSEVFGEDQVRVYPFGNVLVSIAFLAGLATEELRSRELEDQDETFQFLIAIRAVKE